MGTKFEQILNAQFIFVLFQSFEKLKQHNNVILSSLTHVIIDEVHHLLAPQWLKIHRLTKNKAICPLLTYYLGMTATLCHRTDVNGKKLKRLFSNILYIDFPWTVAKKLSFFPRI